MTFISCKKVTFRGALSATPLASRKKREFDGRDKKGEREIEREREEERRREKKREEERRREKKRERREREERRREKEREDVRYADVN